jgi:Leucine-rich repeat (LRR) protein
MFLSICNQKRYAEKNQVGWEGTINLRKLTKLLELYIYNNQIHNIGAAKIINLPRLLRVDLSRTTEI